MARKSVVGYGTAYHFKYDKCMINIVWGNISLTLWEEL